MPEEVRQDLIKKNKSKHCLRKIYTLIDGILSDIIDNLTQKDLYSMIIQITYIFYLLHKNNYTHCDLHSQNIDYINSDKKYLKILKYNVPLANKRQYLAIDFGKVLSPRFKLTKK